MYLMIDNYDSFVYNLKAYFEELGRKILVRRSDQITIAENCAGVISCTDSREVSGEIVLKIRCAGEERLMRVQGTGLTLESGGAYGVRVTGSIEAVSFLSL